MGSFGRLPAFTNIRATSLAGLAAAVIVAVSAAASSNAQPQSPNPTEAGLRPAPVAIVPPLFSQADVSRAVDLLDQVVGDVMQRTGIPGVAVAVVYKDEIIYTKGFGVREVGKPQPVDPDTVFQLASVSKPIASAVIASLVGKKRFDWDDPIRRFNPDFALSDPYVTQNATFADMLSHRSGLATGAGDLLEDLGFDRDTILSQLVQQPLKPFRSTYQYSNFGYTEAGVAAAKAAGTDWEALADAALFKPLGMTRSSYRRSDLLTHNNRARLHVRVGDPADKRWQAKYDRDPDAEAPAGGASGSISDLARFVRLQLNEGRFGTVQLVGATALGDTHKPQVISGRPANAKSRGHFYGFGWNVSYDEKGRARVGHSGAFDLGAATNIAMIPGEELGIVVLTNAQPIGAAEAISETFLDIAQNGRPTVDWVAFLGQVFGGMREQERARAASGEVPADAKPARPAPDYAGVYQNAYFGPLTVRAEGNGLAMVLGPAAAPTVFPLRHIDGDRFVFETVGENAIGLSNATFKSGPTGAVSSVTLDYYDVGGLGTFTR